MPAGAGEVQALFQTAYAAHRAGRLEEAAAGYRALLAHEPQHFDALQLLGALCCQQRDFTQACALLQQASALRPEVAFLHCNLGHARLECGDPAAALGSYEQAIALDARLSDAHFGRGNALNALGRFAEAVASYDRAIAGCPDHRESWLNRANSLLALRQAAAALESCQRALALDPACAEAYVNRAQCELALNQPAAALASCEQAIALRPDDGKAWLNRGVALFELGRLPAAQASYEAAEARGADGAQLRFNQSQACLLAGDFTRGWPLYEARWQTAAMGAEMRARQHPLPGRPWRGEVDLRGSSILLYAEQGLGDSLQFVRYAPWLAAQGASVHLEVPAPLAGLCRDSLAGCQVHVCGEPLPEVDFHCPLLSLPLAWQNAALPPVPGAAYLRSDPALRAEWAAQLGPRRGLRLGLVWSGGSSHRGDAKRSLPLATLLAALPAALASNCELFSLQKEVRDSDLASLAGLRHFGAVLGDFRDTAALCTLMDVVISVDTSVAHLAAALGKPTWLLLPGVPDWRWGLSGEDSPWYPGMRLFRQESAGDWQRPLQRVSQALAALSGGQKQRSCDGSSVVEIAGQRRADEENVRRAALPAAQASFQSALTLFQQGRLAEAGGALERFLKVQPDHSDALQLMGIILGQAKRYEQSIACFDRLLVLQPDNVGALNNRGNALRELARHEEAQADFRRVIALKPGFIDAHYNLGVVLQALNAHQEALASYSRAIELRADHAEAHAGRGGALHHLKRFDEALASYECAIALKADYALAFCSRGAVLEALKRFDEALASYDRAIELKADHAEAHCNRGGVLLALGRLDEALASYQRAIELRADYAVAYCHRGVVLQAGKRFDEALRSYERAIELRADYAEAYRNRGVVLQALGLLDEALVSYQRAIELKADYADAYANLGVLLQEGQRFDEAQASYRRAIELEPDHADAHWNQSLLCLLQGDFAQGWSAYEWRWKNGNFRSAQQLPGVVQPRWLGETSLQGKTILLYHEQGLGDTLQFVRYVPMVAALGGRVLLRVPKALASLLKQVPGVAELITDGMPLPPHDLCCPLLSLPLAFATRLENIPAQAHYLASDPDKGAVWAKRLGEAGGLRVGLAWSGNPAHKNDHNRSLSLAKLLAALPPGPQYISLQKEVRAADQAMLAASGIRHFGEFIDDFSDTAALCSLMDVVISVDTSVAHLSGALGKPTWLLLPCVPDWRWLLAREDSPWYPGMRLFRQESVGDWQQPLQQVAQALESLAGEGLDEKFRLALQAYQQGRWSQAGPLFQEILRREPQHLDSLNLLGGIALQQGRPAEAAELIGRAIASGPGNADSYCNHALACLQLGRFADALADCERALALQPNAARAHFNRGNALLALQRSDEALASFTSAIAAKPDFVDAWLNRGLIHLEREQLPAALADFERALAIHPGSVAAHFQKGNVLLAQDRLAEALASFEQTLGLQPQHADAHCCAGFVLRYLGRLAEADAAFERAIALDPAHFPAWLNLALDCLLQGDFARGLPLYERRHDVAGIDLERRDEAGKPQWRGDFSLAGRRILLHAEQGLGDTLQFCRYAEIVDRQGAEVVLEVQPALYELLRGLPGVSALVARGQPLPDYDCHCSLMSLPLACGTRLESIPARTAYLQADPARLAHWKKVLGERTRPRIGLVWSGNPRHREDRLRSLPLAELLAGLPAGFEYISLHKQVRDGDLAALNGAGLRHFGDQLADFNDTAALCALLDKVVCVDTSVAHLAGALGRPTAVLLPFLPDWRWLLERSDSPWYPTLRLYRQPQRGDWQAPLQALARDLQREFAGELLPQRLQALQQLCVERNWPAAEALCSELLEDHPQHVGVIHRRGLVAYEQGDYRRAADCFAQAQVLRPQRARHAHALSLAQLALGEENAALVSAEAAVLAEPGNADALLQQAACLLRLQRFGEAETACRNLLAAQGERAETCFHLGEALRGQGRIDEALAAYERTLVLRSDFADAYNNRAGCHLLRGDPAGALADCERAIACRPDFPQALANRAVALHELARYDDALAAAEQALAVSPGLPAAHWTQALITLLRGDLKEGWRLYEWRWRHPASGLQVRQIPAPLWLGETSLAGKRLLVHAEQGFGDTLQFSRYLPQLVAQGAQVFFELQPALLGLFGDQPGVTLIRSGAPLPDCDSHCPLLSLPLALGSDSLPGPTASLHVAPERRAAWQKRLGSRQKPRIGLAWSGSPTHINDVKRSIALAELLPHLPADYDYISLQKEVRPADAASLAGAPQIRQFAAELQDFSDTAALCLALDGVLCVDTSVAHLAATLGKPTCILLPCVPDWRWQLERPDTPWYPSVRLLRQRQVGDWTTVFSRLPDELARLLKEKS